MIFPAILLACLARNLGMNVWVWAVIGLIPALNLCGFVALISKSVEFELAYFCPFNHRLLHLGQVYLGRVGIFSRGPRLRPDRRSVKWESVE